MGSKRVFIVILLAILVAIWIGKSIATGQAEVSLMILGGVVLGGLAFFRPDTGLLIVFFSALILPGFEAGVLSDESAYATGGRKIVLRPEDILIVIISIGWLAHSAIQKILGNENRILRSPITMAVTIFMILAAISTVIGIAQGTTSFSRGSLFLIKRFEYFFIFFMTYYTVRRPEQAEFLMKFFLWGSALVILMGVIQRLQGVKLVTSTFTESGANPLASFCLIIIPLLVNLIIENRNGLFRILMAFYLACTIYVFLYTLSRGGYVGFIFAVLVFLLLRRKLHLIIPLVLMGILAYSQLPKALTREISSIEGVLPSHQKSFQKMASRLNGMDQRQLDMAFHTAGIDPSWAARLKAGILVSELVSKYPLLGGGLGSVELSYVDNQYAMDLASLGFVGLALFLFMLYKIIRFLYVLWVKSKGLDFWTNNFAFAMLCGTLGMMVHALTVTNFYTIRTMVPFWFLMGVLAAANRIHFEETEPVEA